MEIIKKSIEYKRENKNIRGVCYIPDQGAGSFPTIIISHGYGGSYHDNLNCAERYASAGYASCSFDFCGGSVMSESDGSTTEMSVLTEVKDLLSVKFLDQCENR